MKTETAEAQVSEIGHGFEREMYVRVEEPNAGESSYHFVWAEGEDLYGFVLESNGGRQWNATETVKLEKHAIPANYRRIEHSTAEAEKIVELLTS